MSKTFIDCFSGVIQKDLLILKTINPAQNIIIESADAREIYNIAGQKKTMFALSPEPAVFKIFFENGDEYAWAARVRSGEKYGDVVMYDLSRIEQH